MYRNKCNENLTKKTKNNIAQKKVRSSKICDIFILMVEFYKFILYKYILNTSVCKHCVYILKGTSKDSPLPRRSIRMFNGPRLETQLVKRSLETTRRGLDGLSSP